MYLDIVKGNKETYTLLCDEYRLHNYERPCITIPKCYSKQSLCAFHIYSYVHGYPHRFVSAVAQDSTYVLYVYNYVTKTHERRYGNVTDSTKYVFVFDNKRAFDAKYNVDANNVATLSHVHRALVIDTTYFFFKTISINSEGTYSNCRLYTSDAADERSSVDLGGRRI